MANPHTQQAKKCLLSILDGCGSVPLEVAYLQCNCDYDSLAGALASLIEEERVSIGRLKTRPVWLLGKKPVFPANGKEIWHTDRKKMLRILPEALKMIRKKHTKEQESNNKHPTEQQDIIVALLEDGIPRNRGEIIALTGIVDIEYPVW
ncbi:MAG: hypothetical protein RQM92_15050 [Candidatus Syntrophopropionicum ammoniitolerans]